MRANLSKYNYFKEILISHESGSVIDITMK